MSLDHTFRMGGYSGVNNSRSVNQSALLGSNRRRHVLAVQSCAGLGWQKRCFLRLLLLTRPHLILKKKESAKKIAVGFPC